MIGPKDSTLWEKTLYEWEHWSFTKDEVVSFSFKDYLKDYCGYEISGTRPESFDYKIVDEKKFEWFLMGGKHRGNCKSL